MPAEKQIFDVVIIGGGVIGLTAAYELRRRLGATGRIAILDQQEPGREASWAGAGMIPPGDHDPVAPVMAELGRLSAARWPGLSAELREHLGIDNGYRRCGSLILCASQKEAAKSVTAWTAQHIDARLLEESGEDLQLPRITFAPQSAYLLPTAAQVRNPWHLRALQVAVARTDDIFSGTPVTGIVQENNRLLAVRTPDGDIYAQQFLLSAGAWTSTLLSQWGLPIPKLAIEPVRGQIILLKRNHNQPWRTIEQGKQYIVTRDDGHVLIGSTEEHAGFCKSTTASGIQGLLSFALKKVPELQAASIEQTWAGLRPYSQRGRPYFGRSPQLSNLLIAAGHFRAGLTLSPGTGILSAELLLEQQASLSGELLAELAP